MIHEHCSYTWLPHEALWEPEEQWAAVGAWGAIGTLIAIWGSLRNCPLQGTMRLIKTVPELFSSSCKTYFPLAFKLDRLWPPFMEKSMRKHPWQDHVRCTKADSCLKSNILQTLVYKNTLKIIISNANITKKKTIGNW